jgi:hypothetical protein
MLFDNKWLIAVTAKTAGNGRCDGCCHAKKIRRLNMMRQHAVVEQFTGDRALLLVGAGERQLVVDKKRLPAGTIVGTWLLVELDVDRFVSATLDPQGEERTKAHLAAKRDRPQKGEK